MSSAPRTPENRSATDHRDMPAANTYDEPADSGDDSLSEVAERLLEHLRTKDASGMEQILHGLVPDGQELDVIRPAIEIVAGMARSGVAGPGASARGDGSPPVDGTRSKPQMLGDYLLHREIGRGGMGVVYEAEQVSLGRRVALKVLPFAAVLDSKQVQRFKNEAQAAARLHHTSIVPIYSVGCERGVHYYAMQFIDGEPLSAVLAQLRELAGRKLSPGVMTPGHAAELVSPTGGTTNASYYAAVARLGAQAADALEHAHEAGVVHRDIKPSNLLIDHRGNLWVTDFGLARIQSSTSLTLTGDLIGTLLYMSPEQTFAKRVSVDHRTDIYSLGATLYELLTLRPVFEGEGREEILRQIAFDEPVWPRRVARTIPAELEMIVLKAIAKSPAERYQTASALAEDLRCFLSNRPIAARLPSTATRIKKWCVRHKALVAIAAAALIVLASSLVAGDLLRRERRRTLEEDYRSLILQSVVAIELGRSTPDRTPQGLSLPEVDPVEKALSDLERARAIFPSRPEVDYQRGRALLALGRKDEAVRSLSRSMARFVPARWLHDETLGARARGDDAQDAVAREIPRPLAAWEEVWLEAYRARRAKSWTAAAAAYGKLLDMVEGSADGAEPFLGLAMEARTGRGRSRLESGDFDGALEDFGAACALWPQRVEPVLLLGRAYLKKGKPELAESRFAELHARSRTPDEVARRVAGNYASLGLYERAIEWAQKTPETSERRAQEASCFLQLRKLDPALASARRAVELAPRSAEAHVSLGSVLYEQGKRDLAEAEFRKAIELDPTNANAHNDLGIAASAAGRRQEATAELMKSIELDPGSGNPHVNLGWDLLDEGKLPEAIAEFRRAVECDPDSATFHANLAGALGRGEDVAGAASEFRRAAELEPLKAEWRFNLGMALQSGGDLDGAIREWEEAARLDPKIPDPHVNLGMAYLEKGRWEESAAQSRKAIELRPKNANAHSVLGLALLKQGKPIESAGELRRAVELDPDHPQRRRDLASCLEMLGEKKDAAAELEKAEELESKSGSPETGASRP
jgi:serine/threonine protein kinase/Flp pilus assembly protein TadD